MVIRAKYENGVFKPLDRVKLKEGTVLEIYLPRQNTKRPSVKDLEFTGMWKYRRDITDGLSYVNKLRDNPRGSRPWQFRRTARVWPLWDRAML